MKKKYSYVAEGYVYGKLWGGGNAFYPALKLGPHNTLKELKKEVTQLLKEGLLDSGMGFEKLIGTKMHVTKITCITVDGESYYRNESIEPILIDFPEKEFEEVYYG